MFRNFLETLKSLKLPNNMSVSRLRGLVSWLPSHIQDTGQKKHEQCARAVPRSSPGHNSSHSPQSPSFPCRQACPSLQSLCWKSVGVLGRLWWRRDMYMSLAEYLIVANRGTELSLCPGELTEVQSVRTLTYKFSKYSFILIRSGLETFLFVLYHLH